MPTCYINRVALQPSGGAGVILASADMVQPSEGDVFVPIRAVPQEGLLNPLGRGTDGVAPAVVVPHLGYRPVRRDQRPHMTQTVYHLVAGVSRVLIPIARAEFTIAPLLKVPPASRGEPRMGSVPPACRGNLKEGVIEHTRFCELWLRDWYKNDAGKPSETL